MKSVTIVTEDRVGLLADISYVLGKSSVNIDALNVEVVGKKAIITLMVRDCKKAAEILEKNGYSTADLDSIIIKLSNKIGEINRIADKLSEEKVSIQNLHVISSDMNDGVFAISVDKPRKAVKLLNEFVMTPDGNEGAY